MLERAIRHIGERYEFVSVPKNNSGWRGPWDCAEFVSWCVFQESQILYGCDTNDPATADAYTGYWERDARLRGTRVPVEQAASIAGAIVLRNPPGSGSMGHIVISDGKGGTVEAKGHAFGVVADTLHHRRWDTGILIQGFTYEGAISLPITQPASVYYPGAPNLDAEVVRQIQQRLSDAGFDPGGVDGVFGSHTAAAVFAFQTANQLLADGEVGIETAAKLGVQLPATTIRVRAGESGSTSSEGVVGSPTRPSMAPIAVPAVVKLLSGLFSDDPALSSVASGGTTLVRSIPSVPVSGIDKVQTALNRLAVRELALAVDLGPSNRDIGYFGPRTERALRALQESRGVTGTGKLERDTLFMLDQALLKLDAAPSVEMPSPGPKEKSVTKPAVDKGAPVGTLVERVDGRNREVIVHRLLDKSGYFFRASMAIDVDGSPRAYSPKNASPDRLDDLSSADDEGSSTKYIQGERNPEDGHIGEGPNPGFFVSGTSLRFNNAEMFKTSNFLDAEKIPYIVFPKNFHDAGLGDMAYVVDLRTFKGTHAICGDTGSCGQSRGSLTASRAESRTSKVKRTQRGRERGFCLHRLSGNEV